MQTKREKQLTGYPSIDKPWLKYYSDKAVNAQMPSGNIYEYIFQNNKGYLKDTALVYFGRNISYGELFQNIDRTVESISLPLTFLKSERYPFL